VNVFGTPIAIMNKFSKKLHNLKRRLGRKLAGSNPHDLAWLLCSGKGLEIGARSNPYPFVGSVVQYADIGDDLVIRKIAEQIDSTVKSQKYTFVDYILTGPKYGFEGISEQIFDFVFSDNVLEHTPNPIYALSEQFRILKPGGIIYCVIPNKKTTFDHKRSATKLEVIVRKFAEDIFDHEIEEAMDVILNTEGHPAALWQVADQLKLAEKMVASKDGGAHYFVFDESNTLSLIHYLLQLFPGYLEHFSSPQGKNIHFAIRKM
jgi:SAM-dependent methyltransferase